VSRRFAIDSFPDAASRYPGRAIVAVDVIRATTTAVTAVDRGHRLFVAASLEHAMSLAEGLQEPLLVGELGGHMPYGFDIQNSPLLVDQLTDRRPIVLLSTGGTHLIHEAGRHGRAYVACLRNLSATARHVANAGVDVAVVGAGTRGEFREEDQLGCAWIAERLLDQGLEPANGETTACIERWRGASVDAISTSASAAYLLRTGQIADLEFVLSHVDDLETAYSFRDGEVVAA
jgi:2-phosphosulfolactate phosphatase